MLARARTEDKEIHPATEMPPSTAGTLLRSRTRIGIAAVFSGTAVGTPLYTTYWGLLKQPDN